MTQKTTTTTSRSTDENILAALRSGEDEASIAARLGCTVSRVHVVAGRYGSGSAAEAERRRRVRDTRSYHVTAVLSSEESRRLTRELPSEVSVEGANGERLVLVTPRPRRQR